MAKDTNIITTNLFPTLEKNLSIKSNTDTLSKVINDYMEKNMASLTKIGPCKMILFTETDKEYVFTLTGLDQKLVAATIKSVNFSTFGFGVQIPVNMVLALCIRYYKMKKNTTMAGKCLNYLIMAMYPSLFRNSWKYEPNEDIMTYTINHMSNKYKIKQLGSLYLTLWDTASLSDKTYEDILLRGNDDDYRCYLQGLNTRIRSLFRKIANEFYINEREKRYMSDEFDNPDPNAYREADSSAFAVERITNATTMNLMHSVNTKTIDLSAKVCQVSKNELRNYINSLMNSKNVDDIKKVINAIIYLYLYDNKNKLEDIKSNKFMIYCLEVYKKSNTTDKNIVEIKKILDKWLKNLGTYKKTQRLATINNFRRAIYVFFVFSIMESA